MKKLLTFVCLLLPLCCMAQTVVIEGTVKEKSNKQPIDGVIVSVLDKDGDVSNYKITDKNGYFNIPITDKSDTLSLQAVLLGYESKFLRIANKSQQLEIALVSKEIELAAVTVKPSAMWMKEDTLVYRVGAFQTQQDRTISDILKKLPGIKVSENGSITYQDLPINKYYVEGLDLVGSRYGIINNNISADAVTSVEVIEHHQPVNLLKGVLLSESAAINLKLKNKIRPVGTATAGLGYGFDDLLWTLNAFAFMGGANNQSVVMYKTNNTGEDISVDLLEHSLGSGGMVFSGFNTLPQGLLSPAGFSNPPLDKKRYLFNQTHIVTLNHIKKVAENKTLRLNLDYKYDSREENIRQVSAYFLPDSLLEIVEVKKTKQKNNLLNGILTYEDNSPKHYLKNMLKSRAVWTDALSDVQTAIPVVQRFDLSDIAVNNDLKFTKKIGRRYWDISSFTGYSFLPQQLKVEADTIGFSPTQTVERSGFYTNNNTYISFQRDNSLLNIKLNVDANIDQLNSDLDHYLIADSLINDLHTDYLKVVLTPYYRYMFSKATLMLRAPLTWHWFNIDDRQYGNKEKLSFLYADFNASLSYKFSALFDLNLSYSNTHSVGDILDFYRSFVMANYRSLKNTSGILSKREGQLASFRLAYRNTLSGLFLNMDASYMTSERNLIAQQRFVGKLSILGNMEQNSHIDSWSWRGYIGQYFSALQSTITFSADYNQANSKRNQQGISYPVRSEMWALTPTLNTKVSESITFNYAANWIINKMTIRPVSMPETKSSFSQFTQKLKAYYFPNKKFQLSTQWEYLYNEITESTHSRMLFADLAASYKHKSLEYTLAWDNIFNEKRYSYKIYNGLDTYAYNYDLRPMSILATISFKY